MLSIYVGTKRGKTFTALRIYHFLLYKSRTWCLKKCIHEESRTVTKLVMKFGINEEEQRTFFKDQDPNVEVSGDGM